MLECSSPRSTSASTANPHSWCALAARCPCWPESRCSRPEIPTSPEAAARTSRSEEHTSELQSRLHIVCRLLPDYTKNPVDANPVSVLVTDCLGHFAWIT